MRGAVPGASRSPHSGSRGGMLPGARTGKEGTMRKFSGVALAATALLVVAGAAAANTAPVTDTPQYNTAAEFTIKGTVAEVKTHTSVQGYTDLHLIMDTEKGPMEVHLGPVAFLTKRGFEFAKGDAVVVTGSRISAADGEVLVAREIRKNEKTLTVRNARGNPVWPKNIKD